MTTTSRPARHWGPLAAVCLAQLLLMLDVTIVIVALPTIAGDLSGDLQSMQLVVDAYALALAALLLNTGAIADRIGRRRVFLVGLGLFGGASALCAAASTATFLVAARALQGVGGAMLFATGLAILGAAYQGADRAKALGAFGAVFGGAVALGPLVGGAIIEVADWRWLFLVNLPGVAVAVVIAVRHVPETRSERPRPVDLVGQLTFTLGIAALVGALIKGGDWGWGDARTVALAAIAAVGLVAFTVSQAVQDDPMFDLSLLRNRSFTGGAIAAFATSAALFGMFVYLILYFQRIDGVDGLHAGMRLLPVTLVAFCAAVGAGRLSAVVSARLVLTVALACSATGLLQMTMLGVDSSWIVALPGLVLCGIGFGLANPTVAAVTLAVSPPAQAATATGMNSTFRQVGVATGVAAMGAIFDHALRVSDAASSREVAITYTDALHGVFLTGSAIAAAGAVLTVTLVSARPVPAGSSSAGLRDDAALPILSKDGAT